MVKDPSIYLPYAFKYNAEVIYVHYELGNTENYIKKIKKNGILAGLAVNPNTMISEFNHLLPLIDNLLVMRVHPGGAGRDSVLEVENKIHELTEIKNREFKIALDGAVSPEIIAKWRLKRVEEFILGTASGLFKNKSYTEVIKDIRLRGVYER